MVDMEDAVSSLGSVVLVSVVLVLMVVAMLVTLVMLKGSRRTSSRATRSRPWQVQLETVCDEARSAVDQLFPRQNNRELPATSVLTAVVNRLRRLDDLLTEIVQQAPARASEAAEEIAQVALALRRALQTERTARITGESGSASRPTSARLVRERSAELEMAIQAARRVSLES